jgi:hypothetical protein
MHFSVIKDKSTGLIKSCVLFLEVQPTIASDLNSLRQNLVPGYAGWWEGRALEHHRKNPGKADVEELDSALIHRQCCY